MAKVSAERERRLRECYDRGDDLHVAAITARTAESTALIYYHRFERDDETLKCVNSTPRIYRGDCGSQNGYPTLITEDKKHMFIGRYYIPKLAPTAVRRISRNTINSLVGRTIVIRSPLYCEHQNGVCEVCLGLKVSGDKGFLKDAIKEMANTGPAPELTPASVAKIWTGPHPCFDPSRRSEAHDFIADFLLYDTKIETYELLDALFVSEDLPRLYVNNHPTEARALLKRAKWFVQAKLAHSYNIEECDIPIIRDIREKMGEVYQGHEKVDRVLHLTDEVRRLILLLERIEQINEVLSC